MDALQRCATVVPVNASPVVLKYCRFHCIVEDQKLYIHATDGKTQVAYALDIVASSLFEEDFDILIDPKIAVPLMPAIKSDQIEFECDIQKSQVKIEGGGHEFTLVSQPSEDFPKFVSPTDKTPVIMPAGILKKMLMSALSVIDKKESRQAMTCASIEYVPGSDDGGVGVFKPAIHIVGASPRTVIFSSFEHDMGEKEFSLLVRNDVIPCIGKVLDDVDDVQIMFSVNKEGQVINIFFKTRRCEIGCTPIGDYKYPNWDGTVPSGVKRPRDDNFSKIAVPTEAFREALNYAEVLADREHKLLKISYVPVSEKDMTGQVILESESESGKAKIAPIEARMVHNATVAFDNYFSGKLLHEVVASLHGNDLIITRLIDNPKKPMRFDSGNVGSDVLVGGIVAPLNPEKLKA